MSLLDKIARAGLKVKAAAMLFPAAIALAKAFEEQIPWSGMGEAKARAIREGLEKAADLTDETLDFLRDIWPILSALIGGAIAIFNASGVFKQGVPAPESADADG